MLSYLFPRPCGIRRAWPALLGVLACLFILAAPAIAAKSVTFTFAPPSGTTGQLTSSRSAVITYGDEKFELSQVIRADIDYLKTRTGFLVVHTPVSTLTTLNGTTSAPPVSGVPMRYELDGAGRLLKVHGADVLMEEILAKMPADVAARVNRQQFQELITAPLRAEWDDVIGRWVGRTVALGQSTTAQTAMTVGGLRPVPAKVSATVNGPMQYRGHQCAKVVTTTLFTTTALKQQMNSLIAQFGPAVIGRIGPSLPTLKSMTATMRSERYIDPTTMLVYGESTVVNMALTMKDPDPEKELLTIRMEERVQDTIEYQ